MKIIKIFIVVMSAVIMSGCAHQIQISPNTESFVGSPQKVDAVVGYHISEADRKKLVETPGGGGDKVSYLPYKDTETILYTVLSNKFKDVYLVNDLGDSTFITDKGITFIFIPEIITDSSSSSAFTWPPTKFIVNLTVKAVNSSGDLVWETQIKETGEAEYDEFKSDFSLSARRATEKAFQQLAKELENTDLLSK